MEPVFSETPARPVRTVRFRTFVICLAAALLAAALLTFFLTQAFYRRTQSGTVGTDGSGENYRQKIALVDEIFRQYSIYDTNGELLLDAMLKAYTAATGDDYAAYYTDEEYAEMLNYNHSSTVGIGVSVTEDAATHCLLVISVSENSPAEQGGVRAGDLIVAVGTGEERVSVAEIGADQAILRLRGEAGTTAAFTVLRAGEEIAFSLVRAPVTSTEVSGKVSESDPAVGIVRIARFSTVTPAQFTKTMDALIKNGCTKFVLDVRNNPGGDLLSVEAVLSFFLSEDDVIVRFVYKDGKTEEDRVKAVDRTGDYADCSVKKEEIGKYRGYSFAVLTNGYSASAAELFTATLADYGIAVTVGETTYGKGIMQNTISLSRWGYSGALKLTVAYFCPPVSDNFHGKGVEPAVPVPAGESMQNKNPYVLSEAEDDQLTAAIQQIK